MLKLGKFYDENGNLTETFKRDKNGKPYVRVIQRHAFFGKKTARHYIDEDMIEDIASSKTLDDLYGYPQGMTIIREESFEPYYDNQTPVATPDGEVVLVDGRQIFRNEELFPVSLGLEDDILFLPKRIREANASAPEVSASVEDMES